MMLNWNCRDPFIHDHTIESIKAEIKFISIYHSSL